MITLRDGPLEADVVPEAGMVVVSLRRRDEELLGLRNGLQGWIDKGSTFGIPLLYPWVNRIADDRFGVGKRDEHGLAIHGLPEVRSQWTVDVDDGRRVAAHLDWPGTPGFPAHRVAVTHELTAGALTVTTDVQGDVPVAFGWHPYLRCDDATDVAVPAMRRLELDDRGLPTGATTDEQAAAGPLGERAYDDHFEAPSEPFRAGAVTVRFLEGAPFAQVFTTPDRDAICFEPMAAPTNALVSGDRLGHAPWRMRFALEVAG